MNILFIALVNGFLLSIAPATVTDGKGAANCPVLGNDCSNSKTLQEAIPSPQMLNDSIPEENRGKQPEGSPECMVSQEC